MALFRWFRERIRQVGLSIPMLLIAGCGAYLHDDNLQKQTDTVLSTYEGADIVGAMKSALDAQAQLDKAELQSVADKESADRERAVADLISTYPVDRDPPKLDFAIERLNFRVNNRIIDLVGTGKFNPQDWLDLHEKIVATTSVADDLRRQLIKQQRAYADAGGTNFTSCDNFSGPDGVPEVLQKAAQELKRECDILEIATQPLKKLQAPIDDALNAKSGEIPDVHKQLGDSTRKSPRKQSPRTTLLRNFKTRNNSSRTRLKTPMRPQLTSAISSRISMTRSRTLTPLPDFWAARPFRREPRWQQFSSERQTYATSSRQAAHQTAAAPALPRPTRIGRLSASSLD
jgi:hypothetical protein